MRLFDKNCKNSGFTVVELLMAMTITTIVSAGIFTAYRSQQNTQLAQKQSVEMQQNIRAALMIMTSEIRMAGYDPDGTNNAGIVNAGDGSDDLNRLIFCFVADNDGVDNANIDIDNDNSVDIGDGNIDESGELKYIEYYRYDSLGDGTIDLGRRNGARLDAIAENIQSLQFTYLDADGVALTVPVTLSDIRSIQITMVATTDANELNYTGTNNTRTLTTTVKCRNLGI